MSKPHKHAELIKLWADGAEIELKVSSGWETTTRPTWTPDFEYRIKPEPKPDVVVIEYWKLGVKDGAIYNNRYYALRDTVEGSATRFTFDGETGKLKAVELL